MISVQLRADDRVLVVGGGQAAELAALGRVLMQGSLVVLADAYECEQGREALGEFDNVMFIEGDLNAVPWRSGFFTKIVVPRQYHSVLGSIEGELSRLLAPGGEIVKEGLGTHLG